MSKFDATKLNKLLEEESEYELSDETINRSTAVREVHARPESQARKSTALKEAQNRPETKAKKSASMNSPETQAKLAAALREKLNRPEVKAKVLAAMSQPDVKAKMAAAKNIPCTIDHGKTVYPSIKEMARALGGGKNGVRSPHFQYLPKGSPANAEMTAVKVFKHGTPCTIDGGKTVYSSRRAMERAIGDGKNGSGSPNFQLLPKGTPSNA